ncbi:YT521-B-like splicing protein [Mycena kentingensis (nom. inval.)]|nr:YT521-B-like splicing protein [Mycena kentingensis (nom. inval.)]
MSPLYHTPMYPGTPVTAASSYHGSPLGPLPLSLSTPSSSAASVSAPSSPQLHPRDKVLVRRSYHPSPPSDRSEWVMWVGNVPADASRDELNAFFTRPPPPGAASGLASSSIAILSAPAEHPTASPTTANNAAAAPWDPTNAGVLSIFPISRSNCAFVNYRSQAHLQTAIGRFNGVPLRLDGKTAPLVCRVRAKDDDLRAGVGAQRGMGMHRRWVESKMGGGGASGGKGKGKAGEREESVPPSSYPLRPKALPLPESKSSTNSSTSTSSSLLEEYFPERFFILKSLTQEDLDLSVQRGVWATQRHNEGVFDRAYRTSKNVYFIFSVNKSGEFYGYARMSGPLGAVDPAHPVKWAAVSAEQQQQTRVPDAEAKAETGTTTTRADDKDRDKGKEAMSLPLPPRSRPELSSGDPFLSEERIVGSPLPTSEQPTPSAEIYDEESDDGGGGDGDGNRTPPHAHANTAPARLDAHAHKPHSVGDLGMKYSLDDSRAPQWSPSASSSPAPSSAGAGSSFVSPTASAVALLDASDLTSSNPASPAPSDEHPSRPMLAHTARTTSGAGIRVQGIGVRHAEEAVVSAGVRARGVGPDGIPLDVSETGSAPPRAMSIPTIPSPTRAGVGSTTSATTWGQEFPLEWLCTTRLPFERTKQLRNPWNSGREVKISRDGTEVEPEVGKAVLRAWEEMRSAQGQGQGQGR